VVIFLSSTTAFHQSGAYLITSLATKWSLFHDMPCHKMALVSRFTLPQNGAYLHPAFTFT
jgi:hypothetical protein